MHLHVLASVILVSGIPIAKGGGRDHVNQYLDMATNANATEAWELLSKAVRSLEKSKELTEAERHECVRRLADILRERGAKPEEILRLMGPDARKQVARQVLYRRYLESWMFETPVRLWVTLDCRKGQDPMVRMVRPLLNEN